MWDFEDISSFYKSLYGANEVGRLCSQRKARWRDTAVRPAVLRRTGQCSEQEKYTLDCRVESSFRVPKGIQSAVPGTIANERRLATLGAVFGAPAAPHDSETPVEKVIVFEIPHTWWTAHLIGFPSRSYPLPAVSRPALR